MHTWMDYVKAVTNILIAIFWILFFLFIVPRVIVFFMPFVIGWVVAMIVSPVVKILEKRLKIVRKAGSAFVIILVLGGVGLIGYLIVAKLVEEGAGFLRSLPVLYESMEKDLQEIFINMERLLDRLPLSLQQGIQTMERSVNGLLGSFIEKVGASTVTSAAGSVAKNLPTIAMGVIMALLSSYLFVAQKNEINETIKAFLPSSFLHKWNIVWTSLAQAVGGYFKAQLKIMVVVFFILGIGFGVLKVNYSLFIAFLTALLDFLPFFGTGAVIAPWAVFKFMSRDYGTAFGLLILWGVSQFIRQLIQPKLVGDSVGMRPIPTLFLLYVGFRIGGVVGMIIAIPIGMITYNLYKAGLFDETKKSIKLLVEGINQFRKF